MKKFLLLTQFACTIATASLVICSDKNERDFINAFVQASINPTDSNLAKLKNEAKKPEVTSRCIVSTICEYFRSGEALITIKTIAAERPYTYFIADKKQPIPLKTAILLLNYGFITPHVCPDAKHVKGWLPIAYVAIRTVELSTSPGTKNLPLTKWQAFDFMKTLLTSGLSPFYEYPSKDRKINLYTYVKESKISDEDKSRFTQMFDDAIKEWSEEEKANTLILFRRGSLFSWTEKGAPFALAELGAGPRPTETNKG